MNLASFLDNCRQQLNLDIVGLMCIPPISGDTNKYFKEMDNLKNQHNLSNLSMGMSSDYMEAINHEATFVRIGSKIFGDRDQAILILVFFEINLLNVKKSFSFNAIHPAVGL